MVVNRQNMKTIILSFFLLFREYFLSKSLVVSRKVISVIDFSRCNMFGGRWWPKRGKFRVKGSECWWSEVE
jgi:hypothetical protein